MFGIVLSAINSALAFIMRSVVAKLFAYVNLHPNLTH